MPDSSRPETRHSDQAFAVAAPQVSLPKGGGAISGIGEKFGANPVTGTGSMSVPVFTSPGRSGFGPTLSLSYDSGAGNGPIGCGWSHWVPNITCRTDKGLPHLRPVRPADPDVDIFVLSGAEDLVPILAENAGRLEVESKPRTQNGVTYEVRGYRPRIEGLFARIERWTDSSTGISHWRSISRDNVTTLYGTRDDARIADPSDKTRIFSWLLSESYDDKGNAILYRYKPEDGANIDRTAPCERNRLAGKQFSQRYLKSIYYGNRTPRTANEDLALRDDWLFEAVFDYGEHDDAAPATKETRTWPVRQDPFSSFRATFDVRTYRLCRRILMFHHFPDELGGTTDYLVRSTDLEFKESSVASFIAAVTQAGYTQQPDKTYFKKTLPKLEFKYTEAVVDETLHQIDPASIEHIPRGVDGTYYQWVDLDSEGMPGVLSQQTEAWFYKRNLGNGTFGPLEQVALTPSLATLGAANQQLLDLAGAGRLDLVQFGSPLAGFFERTAEGNWENFAPFVSAPNIDTRDPNLRFVDITGDGHPDILISEDTVFTWYESRAKDGFAPAQSAPMSWDEEKGPKLVFSDPIQSIFLADMSGDGLSDIVRICYREVCYWPNMGYGRFGAKVTMGNAPQLESEDTFDPRRIHLADIDGSGNSDIIYVGQNGISLHFNQSGNAWGQPRQLKHFPSVDNLTSIAATDLLGNGTACLVWSSPLATDAQRPMRYIDLMGGQKPHLLISATNNMGAQTEMHYAASTTFYLGDRLDGRPWITKPPFPVHVIDRVETRDLVSNTKLVTTHRYRDGYFDGVEREFHGFAYVEQRDTESVIGEFDQPPVVTKTWFHNGAFLEGAKLEAYYKDASNHEFFAGDAQATFLPDTALPPGLTVSEMREATRALKGNVLRQEVYADDGSVKAAVPYSVSERSYKLTCFQRQGPNRHAVFFSHASETVDYHYERESADPRISHALTLAVDDYGNVLKSVAIGYQRRTPAFDEQKNTLATLTETQYTNTVLQDDVYRTPLPAQIKTFELTAPTLAGATTLALSQVNAIATDASEIAYDAQPAPEKTQKRLIEQVRTTYRKDDLSGLLPIGQVESLALPGESYKLAFTQGLLDIFQSKTSRAELSAILADAIAGYRNLDGDGPYWIPSGRVFYSRERSDSPLQESTFARAHFFLPHRFEDPFGSPTVVGYDAKYQLVLVSARDAVGNETTADPDYRVLQPTMVTDANGNRTEARFDALGMLAGTAVRGKAIGVVEGDSFELFTADLTQPQIDSFFKATDPRALALTHLGTATTRIVYDLERVPVCAAAIARETHVSDLSPGQETKVQLHFAYSDGFGREAQTKVPAEPGPLDLSDPSSPVANPRWACTGAKIYNNKGKTIREFEPFFSSVPQFGVEKWGVSSTHFYDPVDRVVATLHPNHTFEKVIFDPWQQTTFDVNDTVTFDPKTDPDVGEFFSRIPDADYLPTWRQQRIDGAKGSTEKAAAEKSSAHADTPSVSHFDTLGRAFLTIVDNGKDPGGNDQQYRTRTVLDIEGNQRQVIDALDRVVMRYEYDMLGTRIAQASMEAGTRLILSDVAGKPIRAWDDRGFVRRFIYDSLHRPTGLFVTEPGGERLAQQTIYGEAKPSPEATNHRGRVWQVRDDAGIVTSAIYDFKGGSLNGRRDLRTDYKAPANWLLGPATSEVFTSSSRYDALGRVIESTAPDGSVTIPRYNEATLLEAVDVRLSGAAAATPFVRNIDYNAKGQRSRIDYSRVDAPLTTTYTYDPDTSRLTRLLTVRPNQADAAGRTLQDLRYTFDPSGNITHIQDDAQQPIFFRNKRVEPSNEYTYDALYRLTEARGREHLGQAAAPTSPDAFNTFHINHAHPGDGNAMGTYVETFDYDATGNFKMVKHDRTDPALAGWTRSYAYNEPSLIEPAKLNNRLSSSTVGGSSASVEPYTHDVHGNIISMPHLPVMTWDFADQLTQVDLLGGGKAYYVYDSAGQRVRKVIERIGAIVAERIYFGGYEVYRKRTRAATTLERQTLHVMDDQQRIALVETRMQGDDGSPSRLIRYQFGNHLGSSSLELDDAANVISYEEYLPYGSTSYQAVDKAVNMAGKRYRYTGKERDEDTGFAYHQTRYYASWLGRWTSCDSTGIAGGLNLFCYSSANPIVFVDPNGQDPMGNYGDVNRHGAQGLRGKGTPGALESEHLDPIAVQREAMRNPSTGQSPIPPGRDTPIDRAQPTVMLNKATADAKTRVDKALIIRMKAESKAGTITLATASETGSEAGLARTAEAARLTGTTVPAGANVAAIGQTDALHADPAVRAFSRDPANNPIVGATDAEVSAAVDVPIDSIRRGSLTSVVPNTESGAKTVFKGNYVEVPARPKVGLKVLKGVMQGAEAGAFVVGLGLEGENEVSSGAAVLKMAAGAGALRLAAAGLKTPAGMVVAAGAIGAAAGYIAQEELHVGDYSAAIGGRVDSSGGVLGGIVTVAATPVSLTLAAIDAVAGGPIARLFGIGR